MKLLAYPIKGLKVSKGSRFSGIGDLGPLFETIPGAGLTARRSSDRSSHEGVIGDSSTARHHGILRTAISATLVPPLPRPREQTLSPFLER